MTLRPASPAVLQAPADLVAMAVGGRQVILAWTESGSGGQGFRIERADGSGPASRFAEIGAVGSCITAFSDRTVKPRASYSYRVRASNAAGDSPASNVAHVTTPQAETNPPDDAD